MGIVRQYARIGAASCCLVAAAALALCVLSYFSAHKASVFDASKALGVKAEFALIVGLAALAIGVGFLFTPQLASVLSLAGTAILLVVLVLYPIHAGAGRGLGMLFVGPVIAAVGVLKNSRHTPDL